MRIYHLSDIAGRSPCSSYPCPPCPCSSCPCLPCSMSIAHSTFNLNNSADTEVALQELKSSKAHTGRARRPQRKMKLFIPLSVFCNHYDELRLRLQKHMKMWREKIYRRNPNVSGRAAGNFPRVFYFPDRRAITWLICLQVWIRPPGYFQSFNPIVNVLLCSVRSSLRKGSSIYYVIIFGGLGRPLPPYVICNHLGLPPPM